MEEKSCCFSGHRQLPQKDLPKIKTCLENEILRLIHQGVLHFLCGGALGFDTIAALAVLNCKSKYKRVKLTLALPCKEQEKYWSVPDKIIYAYIKLCADKIIYTSENYFRGCMHVRNRYLIDSSDYLICYLAKETGGTAYTASYAKKQGLEIMNLFNN